MNCAVRQESPVSSPCFLREAIEKNEDSLHWNEETETEVEQLGLSGTEETLEKPTRRLEGKGTKASEARTRLLEEGPLLPEQSCSRSWGEERREEMRTDEDPSTETTTRLSSKKGKRHEILFSWKLSCLKEKPSFADTTPTGPRPVDTGMRKESRPDD